MLARVKKKKIHYLWQHFNGLFVHLDFEQPKVLIMHFSISETLKHAYILGVTNSTC